MMSSQVKLTVRKKFVLTAKQKVEGKVPLSVFSICLSSEIAAVKLLGDTLSPAFL